MRFILLLLMLPLLAAMPAGAQTVTQTFVLGGGANAGGGSPAIQFAPDQTIMFNAANKFMQRDFPAAESLYSQAIALNPKNTDALLQRAAVRRELGNEGGMASDAQNVIALSNQALQKNPNDPNSYYERGMAYRLLKEYDEAKADIAKGMQIGGKKSWATDLKAIEIERKYVQ